MPPRFEFGGNGESSGQELSSASAGIADPLQLQAWLAARSVARGLPRPEPDFGGFRVDTGTVDEKARWVFPTITSGFHTLARSISQPGYLLKLCGTPRQLLDALPSGWKLHEPGYFMRTVSKPPEGALADGYTIEINRNGPVITATIFAASGEQAASGHAAETPDAFVYDRIVTEAGHRRRGLASFLIGALHDARSHRETPQFLVATAQGHLLYAALGWELLSPYSTASIAAV